MRRFVVTLLAALALVVGAAAAPVGAQMMSDPVTGRPLHWQVEPYYGTGVRYVWVFDGTNDPLFSTQIQRWIEWVNGVRATWSTNLPHFIYHGYGAGDCSTYHPNENTIKVCRINSTTPTGQATHYITSPNSDHIRRGNVYLGNVTGPAAHWNLVCHEFGHMIGFDHNPVMESCMWQGYKGDYELAYTQAEWNSAILAYAHTPH